MISTRSVGLVIDTVVCLTLAKWETASGQFGGYLMGTNPEKNKGEIGLTQTDASAFEREARESATRESAKNN